MPIYEYQCEACGHQLEIMHSISAEPERKCPVCEKSALIKLVSAPSFQLKGTGWYETDFKTKPKGSAADTDTASTKTNTTTEKTSTTKKASKDDKE